VGKYIKVIINLLSPNEFIYTMEIPLVKIYNPIYVCNLLWVKKSQYIANSYSFFCVHERFLRKPYLSSIKRS
jgi:hypothetical protein